MDMKIATSMKVNGQHIDLAGRIVKLTDNEYSCYTNVTFYCPETRGSAGQGDSDFRTEKMLAAYWYAKANASDRIQKLFQLEQDSK